MNRLRVALETQFAVGTPTGLGVYASGLAGALRMRNDVEVVELADPRFDLWRFDRRIYWDQIRVPALADKAGADIVHFTGGTLPWRVRGPLVLTLHDLVWLRGANRGRFYVKWYYGAFQPRLVRRADAILADTDAAKADIVDALGVDPERIFVTGIGIDDAYFAIERRPEDPPFVLAVGTVEERKDLATAVRALTHLPDVRLVSVGPFTPYADVLRAIAAEGGVADRLELRGYVDTVTLRDLYARASVLVFPSRYEGFGLPPLQALACRLPVVAARIPVTLEVLGDCAAYVEPGDWASLAAAIRSTIEIAPQTRIERGRSRAETFTWAQAAGRVVSVYRTLIESAPTIDHR